MTIKEELQNYLDKKTSANDLIRTISGAFNPEHAVDLLVLVNQITRIEAGDLDVETFKTIWGL